MAQALSRRDPSRKEVASPGFWIGEAFHVLRNVSLYSQDVAKVGDRGK